MSQVSFLVCFDESLNVGFWLLQSKWKNRNRSIAAGQTNFSNGCNAAKADYLVLDAVEKHWPVPDAHPLPPKRTVEVPACSIRSPKRII